MEPGSISALASALVLVMYNPKKTGEAPGGMLCFVIGAGGMSMNVCAVKGVEAYSD